MRSSCVLPRIALHLPGKPGGGKPRPPPGGWKPGGGPPGKPPGGKPGGGPPLPGNPAGGAPGNPGPPTPAAGPCNPAPLPAGLAIPCPACIAAGAPPDCAPPASLAAGSEGGRPSTEHETTFAPRTIASPSMRFSSVSTVAPEPVWPGAPVVLPLRFTRRNSSQSERTRFMNCRSAMSAPCSHSP